MFNHFLKRAFLLMLLAEGCQRPTHLTIEIPSAFHGNVDIGFCVATAGKATTIRLPMSGEANSGICVRSNALVTFMKNGKEVSPRGLSFSRTGDQFIAELHAVIP